MIIVVDALNRHRFEDLLTEMHKLRARVFEGRLGWDVTVEDGAERDDFDNLDPAHVIALNDTGDVVGCMRLLQTTGPHMLSDVFHSILDGEPPLRNAQLWEATRFCVDTQQLDRGKTKNSISYVTSEVMIGAFEYAKSAGVLDAVAVIDPVMDRVLKRSGNAPYDYVGSAKPMGKVTAMAALMDCSDTRISQIRAFSNITHDVFTPEEAILEVFTAAQIANRKHEAPSGATCIAMPKRVNSTADKSAEFSSDLSDYLTDLLQGADSAEELEATRALTEALETMMGHPLRQPATVIPFN